MYQLIMSDTESIELFATNFYIINIQGVRFLTGRLNHEFFFLVPFRIKTNYYFIKDGSCQRIAQVDIVPVSSLPGIPSGCVVKYLANKRCVSF